MTEQEYPLENESGKRYKEQESSNGDLLRIYEDGTVYNMDLKRLEAGPESNRISTDSAGSMVERRIAKRREAVERAIAAGESVEAGIEELATAQRRVAMEPEEFGGHASTRAFQALIEAAGLGDKTLVSESVSLTQNGVRLEGTPERLAELALALERERERRLVRD